MIITKLTGGLGNQLFQYAIGRNLIYINGSDLKLDGSEYDVSNKGNFRHYALDKFNTIQNFASKKETNNFKFGVFKKWLYKSGIVKNKNYFLEKKFNFDKEILKIKDNAFLQGYWQSEKYFIGIRDILLQEFSLKENIELKFGEILKEINESNSVSIDVRRGDYVKNPKNLSFHGVCSPKYYSESTSKIASLIEKPVFFVFSDDIEWVKENLNITFPVVYLSGIKNIKSYEELVLMSKCKHNIIANSSFSWWGAWLNTNQKKIVIAPKRWFNDVKLDTTDLIPENWIRI